jgi:hypothetical protein
MQRDAREHITPLHHYTCRSCPSSLITCSKMRWTLLPWTGAPLWCTRAARAAGHLTLQSMSRSLFGCSPLSYLILLESNCEVQAQTITSNLAARAVSNLYDCVNLMLVCVFQGCLHSCTAPGLSFPFLL